MIYVTIYFPANRYHATPWGNHVNEGLVEWPPSPWRLLRAFYSVGFTHLGWVSGPPPEFTEIVEAIADSPPEYKLPASTMIHTRHYMPVEKNKTSKVIDACRRINEDQSLVMRFPGKLSTSALQLLKQLAGNTAYLGRAESWVNIEVHTECASDTGFFGEAAASSLVPAGHQSVRLLTPVPAAVYEAWRSGQVKQVLHQAKTTSGKAPTAVQTKKLSAPYPEDMLKCVGIDTIFLRKHGWSQPPGTRWIDYHIPNDSERPATTTGKLRGIKKSEESRLPTTALLSFTSDSVSGTTLPPIGRALFVAEAAHKAAVSRFTKKHELLSFALSGHGVKGEQHQHGHFIPIDADGDSKLDHLIIHCPSGLDPDTQEAIAAIERLYMSKLPAISVTWIGCSSLQHVSKTLRDRRNQPLKLFMEARRFKSVTPYVASKHLRRRYGLAENVAEECQYRSLPAPNNMTVLESNGGRFRLARIEDKRRPPREHGHFIEIEFDVPMRGPLSLGYGCHFGLGLFEAVG